MKKWTITKTKTKYGWRVELARFGRFVGLYYDFDLANVEKQIKREFREEVKLLPQ